MTNHHTSSQNYILIMRNYHECFPFTAELGPVSESVDHVQKLAVNTAASEGTSEEGKYI